MGKQTSDSKPKDPQQQQSLERFSVYLENVIAAYGLWYTQQHGKKPNLYDVADWLQIDYSCLSSYRHKRRMPSDVNLAILGRRLGSTVYTILGKTPPMPNSMPAMMRERWTQLNEDQQQQILALVESMSQEQTRHLPSISILFEGQMVPAFLIPSNIE